MNERITLRFIDYDNTRARVMLDMARRFAVENTGSRRGERHACVYAFTTWACSVWWTDGGAIVVRELAQGVPS